MVLVTANTGQQLSAPRWRGPRLLLALAMMGGLVQACTIAGLPAPVAQTDGFVLGQIIVRFREDVSEDRIKEINRSQNATVLRIIQDLKIYLLKLPVGVTPPEGARRYRLLGEVVAADPNFVIRAQTNDPLFSQQWYFENSGANANMNSTNFGFIDADIDAPEAWLIGMGAANIKIAILDTGIDGAGPPLGSAPVHPDLAGKVVAHANFSSDQTTDDLVGHGTHVAGLAAAITDNGVFIAGTCPLCSLLNAKVLDAGGAGDTFGLIGGLNWAANNGATILNASVGGLNTVPPYDCPGTLQSTIDTVVAPPNNAIVVVAAGNNSRRLAPPFTAANPGVIPAICKNVVTVAATDARDERAYFSNYGAPIVAIAAPGTDVVSLLPPATTKRADGTSMAAPMVAGALGVVWAHLGFPGTPNSVVVNQVLLGADKIDGTQGYPGYLPKGNVDLWQAGRLNLCRALGAPHCDQPLPSFSIVRAPTFEEWGGTVTLDLSTGTTMGADDPFGATDGKWRVIQVPSSTYGQLPTLYPVGFYPAFSTQHYPGSWIQDPSGANWIHPVNSPGVRWSSTGFYKYRILFDLPAEINTDLSLTGVHAEDDQAEFFLNGNLLIPGPAGLAGSFVALTPFAYTPSGPGFFTAGVNSLVVKVENMATVTGLLVKATFKGTCIPPAYDISLQKARTGTNYTITLVNVGSPIVGPAMITVADAFPAGLKVTGGSGGGVSGSAWTMSPGVGTVGPQQITLTYTIGAGTTVPTGGQIAEFGLKTVVDIDKNCAKAELSVNNVVVSETDMNNNAACSP